MLKKIYINNIGLGRKKPAITNTNAINLSPNCKLRGDINQKRKARDIDINKLILFFILRFILISKNTIKNYLTKPYDIWDNGINRWNKFFIFHNFFIFFFENFV